MLGKGLAGRGQPNPTEARIARRAPMATLLGLFCTFILPVVLLFSGNAVAICLGGAALMLMSFCYLPMIRFYRLSPLWSLCLPPTRMHF